MPPGQFGILSARGTRPHVSLSQLTFADADLQRRADGAVQIPVAETVGRAPICTPATTEFGGVEATSGTAAAAASLPKNPLEYTGFTSLSLPTYYAARGAQFSCVNVWVQSEQERGCR